MDIGQTLVWQAFIFFVVAVGFGVASAYFNDTRPRGEDKAKYVCMSVSLFFATLVFVSLTLAIWSSLEA